MRTLALLSLLIIAFTNALATPNSQPSLHATENNTVTVDEGQRIGQAQQTIEGQNTPQQPTNPLNNPNSFASQYAPTNNEFSQANQKLLTRNAELQRQVNSLETQVNVLVNERSGQLFLYGALTVFVSLLTGIVISWLIISRRERW